MNLILTTIAIAMLGACSPHGAVNNADNGMLDTNAVIEQVNDIYAKAFAAYGNSADASMDFSSLDRLDSLYCSADWNVWVARVNAYDSEHEEDGMMGFFDADYWIMGQDWQDLAVSDVKVTSLTDSKATVALNLHNCGSVTAVQLELSLEDGMWKIDNFIDVSHDVNWKAGMQDYLAGVNAN